MAVVVFLLKLPHCCTFSSGHCKGIGKAVEQVVRRIFNLSLLGLVVGISCWLCVGYAVGAKMGITVNGCFRERKPNAEDLT